MQIIYQNNLNFEGLDISKNSIVGILYSPPSPVSQIIVFLMIMQPLTIEKYLSISGDISPGLSTILYDP